MKRGAVVVVAAKGAYTGKPRPALVVQTDSFNPTHESVTICPISSDCVDAPLFRIPLPPGDRTGLRKVSQIMVDKVASVPRSTIGAEIGSLNDSEMKAAGEALGRWLGLDERIFEFV